MKKLLLALMIAAVSASCSQMRWPASCVSTEVKITTRNTLQKGALVWLGEKDAKNSVLFVNQRDIKKGDELLTLRFPESMRGKQFYVRVYEGLLPKGDLSCVQPKEQGSFTVGTSLTLVLDGDDSYTIHFTRIFGSMGAPHIDFSHEMKNALLQKEPKN